MIYQQADNYREDVIAAATSAAVGNSEVLETASSPA